jgi:hypothetical protein
LVATAIVYFDALIDKAAVHPDGLLVLSAGEIGKITRNDKGSWALSPAQGQDLEIATVHDRTDWEQARASLLCC